MHGGQVSQTEVATVTDGLGWPWIFFINLPVCVVLLALSPAVLRESRAGPWGAGTRPSSPVKLVDGWQRLTDGPAWVRFCVFDGIFAEDILTHQLAWSYRWKTVKVHSAS
jgi:hypothetical protein